MTKLFPPYFHKIPIQIFLIPCTYFLSDYFNEIKDTDWWTYLQKFGIWYWEFVKQCGEQLITVAFDFACAREFFTRNWSFRIAIFSDLKFLVFISQDFGENLKLKISIKNFWIWINNSTYFWLTKLEIRSKDRKDFILLDGLNVWD